MKAIAGGLLAAIVAAGPEPEASATASGRQTGKPGTATTRAPGSPAPSAGRKQSGTPADAVSSGRAPAGTLSKAAPRQGLRRADFRVSGASCAACLRKIARTIRETPGVIKADVSIFKPFWGVAIYDSSQVTLEKILANAREEDSRFEQVEDVPIAQVPAVVLPKSSPALPGKQRGQN